MSALILDLHIQPGARRTEVAGMHGGRLKIRLAAPPVDGKANEALIAFLSEALHVPRRNVTIASGAGSRQKRVVVEGYTGELPWKSTKSG